MANPFVHMELMAKDIAKAKAFYGKLFDWTLEDMPGGNDTPYTLIKVGEGTGGGMMQTPMPNGTSMWVPYVLVDDLEATAKKAQSLGASVMMGKTEVPNMGAFIILSDQTGGMVGLWKTKMA